MVLRKYKICIRTPWVDGLAVLYCETAVTEPSEIAEHIHRAIKDRRN